MKKIKYLLGFSIVGVGLLINNIFAASCNIARVQYVDQNNNTILFSVGAGGNGSYYSGFYNVNPDYMLFTGSSPSNNLNFSSYGLTGFTSMGWYYYRNHIYLSFNSISIPYNQYYYNNYRFFKPTIGTNSSSDLSFSLKGTYNICPSNDYENRAYYLHINGDSSCIDKNVLTNGNCDFDSYVFEHSSIPYSIINSYTVHDSVVDGVEYFKGPITFSTKNTYSFWITNYSGTSSNNNWSNPDTFFLPRTVVYTDTMEDVQYIDGIYFARLYDNLYSNNSSDFKIIGIFGSGTNEYDYQFLYNLYNCPSNALTPYDCSFLTGGYLLPSSGNNSHSLLSGYSFPSCNNGSLFCSGDYSFPLLLSYVKGYSGHWTSDSVRYLDFYWSYNSDNGYLLLHQYEYGFNEDNTDIYVDSVKLSNSPAVSDILTGTTPPDLPDDTIPTYNNIPFSSLYYQCLGPSYNTPDGLPPAFCLNPDGTLIDLNDYKDCYFTVSGSGDLINNMYCNNDGYVQEMAWIGDGSGGYYSSCNGGDCGVMYVIGPDYLNFEPYFSLSTGLIEDMFTNVTGWIARCPFPYTDFQLGKNSQILKYLKTLGFKYDPFIFINCIVAGFNHGRHIIDDIAFDNTFEHPLIYGDTSQHRLLFVFLDFIVILGLFSLLSFIKKIF